MGWLDVLFAFVFFVFLLEETKARAYYSVYRVCAVPVDPAMILSNMPCCRRLLGLPAQLCCVCALGRRALPGIHRGGEVEILEKQSAFS